MNAGCHQRAHRLIGGHRRRGAREVANARGHDRDTHEGQDTAQHPQRPGGFGRPGVRQRQQVIQGKPEDKATEIEEWRAALLSLRLRYRWAFDWQSARCSSYLPRHRASGKDRRRHDNLGVILGVDNMGVDSNLPAATERDAK